MNSSLYVLLELLNAEEEYILLSNFNLYHPFYKGVIVISVDNATNNLIYTIKVAGLSLATKIGIKI